MRVTAERYVVDSDAVVQASMSEQIVLGVCDVRVSAFYPV